ncbi:MAG: hypothetical protein IJU50_02770 [Lachnospiraceae bacterium]|nr:hypothetical protein [Lachnospiraceae bacterium]
MLSKILKRETCAECRICCVYDDSDVWDAPGFTEEEFQRNAIEGQYDYFEKNGLCYLNMEKGAAGLYQCPCLTEKGCKLGNKKPFRCAVWPLYVVKTDSGYGVAVSDVCPQVYPMEDQKILEGIRETLPKILETVRKDPSLIEELRENYRLIARLDEKEIFN